MGLKDFFSGRRGSRAERQVAKAAKKLMNKHVQTGERKRCIDVLAGVGSDEAVAGLLMRFTYRTDVQIVDEDEKEEVYHAILGLGESALPAIEDFLRKEMALYWPLRALSQIAGEDTAVAVLLREIDAITENFDRDVQRKHELVSNLREYPHDERVYDKLVALLGDEQEDVRILAIDGLSMYEDRSPVAQLLPLLLSDDETIRVKQMVLDLLVQKGWSVKKYKRDLAEKLPSQFWVDDKGKVQRR